MSAGCVRGLANMFIRTIFDLIFDLTEGQALKVNLKFEHCWLFDVWPLHISADSVLFYQLFTERREERVNMGDLF